MMTIVAAGAFFLTVVGVPGLADYWPAPGSVPVRSGVHSAHGGAVSDTVTVRRAFFLYPEEGPHLRDPFRLPENRAAADPGLDSLQLLGILYHETPENSVVLVGVDSGDPAAGGNVGLRTALRLRVGDRLGSASILEIRPDRMVVDTGPDAGEGAVARTVEIWLRPGQRSVGS